jgi:hypothetical protein
MRERQAPLKVLIVKLSSLGDVVHTMPAVMDIQAAFANAQIDWVVERGFACLRAAPVRISCPDHPAPSSPFLAESYYPTALTLAQAVLTLADPTPAPALAERLHLALARTGAHDTPYHNFCGPF